MARISVPSLTHLDALPVRSTIGVAKPWQVQPSTLIGPPPPLPGASPDLMASAYLCSINMAVAQLTWPEVTSMWIGTFAAVLVEPHDVVVDLTLAGELPQPTATASSRAVSTA